MSIFNSLNLKKSTEFNKCVDKFKNEVKTIEGRIAKDLLISPRRSTENPNSIEKRETDRYKLIEEIATVKSKRQPHKRTISNILDKEYKIRRLKIKEPIFKQINNMKSYMPSGIHSTLVSPMLSRDQSPIFSPDKTAALDFAGSVSKRVFVPKIDMTKLKNGNMIHNTHLFPFSNVNSKYNSSSRLDSGNNSSNVSFEMSKRTLLFDTNRKELKLNQPIKVKVNDNIFRTDTKVSDYRLDTKDKIVFVDKSPIKLTNPMDSRSNSKSKINLPNVYSTDKRRKQSIHNLIDKLPQIIERSESISKSIIATTKSFKKK
jgi:hypothetical protein